MNPTTYEKVAGFFIRAQFEGVVDLAAAKMLISQMPRAAAASSRLLLASALSPMRCLLPYLHVLIESAESQEVQTAIHPPVL